MSQQYNLQKIANQINQEQKLDLQVSEMANQNKSTSFVIRILSLLGGIIANVTFIVFLFAVDAFKNGWVTFFIASILIVASLFFNKIKDIPFLETLMTSTYLAGICCLLASLYIWGIDETIISVTLAIIALLSFYFINDFIIRLLGVITFFLALLYALAPLNSLIPAHLLLIICLVAIVLMLKNEANWFANKKINTYYQPLLTGIQATAIYLSLFKYNITPSYYNISLHIIICSILFWVVYGIIKSKFDNYNRKFLLLIFPLALIAICSFYEVKMLLSLIFLLIAFNYKELLFLSFSVLYFITSIGLFYYDLSITLLYKSLILMASGGLFLCLYFIIKSIPKNEKNI